MWCVTWPKIGTGRHRQFFKDKSEAETLLQQKLILQENYGTAGFPSTIGSAPISRSAREASTLRRDDPRRYQLLSAAPARHETNVYARSSSQNS